MKRKILPLILTLSLCLGLAAPAMAYNTPDFSDVPANHWAYEAIMKMADAGIIKGVGGDRFAPEDTLTAEMFLVLVGRVVFPEVTVEGADWSGPYVAEAKAKGLLEGTNVTDATLKGEISRYDMAMILTKCLPLLAVGETKADSVQVADYGEIPIKYGDAVLTVYGSGLIQGDQTGSFNGQNSMTRQEAATVMARLLGLKPDSSQGGGTTDAETPAESQQPSNPDDDWEFAWAREYVPDPYDPDAVELKQGNDLHIYKDFMKKNALGIIQVYLRMGETLQLTVDMVPAGYDYTKDDVQWYSDDESVAIVSENGLVTAVGEGEVHIRATIPVIYYRDIWTERMDFFKLYCEQ